MCVLGGVGRLESSWVTVIIVVTGAEGPVGGRGRALPGCPFRKAPLGYACPGWGPAVGGGRWGVGVWRDRF